MAVNFLKKIKNKGLWLVVLINTILFIVDIVISMNIKYISLIEMNPLYNLGGFILVILYNVGLFGLFGYWYCKTKNTDIRFILMTYMCVIMLFRLVVINNNYDMLVNPVTYEQAIAVTDEIKTDMAIKIGAVNLISIFVSLVIWLFYRIDHRGVIK